MKTEKGKRYHNTLVLSSGQSGSKTESVISDLLKELSLEFGGTTYTQTFGTWVDPDNEMLKFERGHKIEVSTVEDETDRIREIVKGIEAIDLYFTWVHYEQYVIEAKHFTVT